MNSSARRLARVLSAPSTLATLAAFASISLASGEARADLSGWFSANAGPAWLSSASFATRNPAAMRLELGTGSAPTGAVVLGGIAKTTTYFGAGGTDLAILARGATGGFARGTWGFAIDAGGYERYWGAGSSGFNGAFVLGGPWGAQAMFDYQQGSNDAKTYAVFVGIDLLRLTVYRTTGTDWMPNPSPAVKTPADR